MCGTLNANPQGPRKGKRTIMDEEAAPIPKSRHLGADLSRLSVRELEELRAACLQEAERIALEIETKGATRAAADSVFKF